MNIIVAIAIAAAGVALFFLARWWLKRNRTPAALTPAQERIRVAREQALRDNFNPAELKRVGLENAEIARLRLIREKAERDYQVDLATARALGLPDPPRPPGGKVAAGVGTGAAVATKPTLSFWFVIAWVLWILAFGVIEFIAVRRRTAGGAPGGDTLSELVWWLIATKSKKRTAIEWICRGALLLLFGWLIPHWFTGWLSG